MKLIRSVLVADPAYADGSGTSVVRYEIPLSAFTARNVTITATLYYQSIPPYFLNDRFTQAPESPSHATALLLDVEPADERDADRKLEIPNHDGEPGGYAALATISSNPYFIRFIRG